MSGDRSASPRISNISSQRVPTYAEILSTSPDPLTRSLGLHNPSPRQRSNGMYDGQADIGVTRQRPLRRSSGGRSWSIFGLPTDGVIGSAADRRADAEEGEDAEALFQASLERGNTAQARRLRLLERPRDDPASSEYVSYGDMMNPERRGGGNRQATATPSAPSHYVDYGDLMSPDRPRDDNAFRQDDEESREALAIWARYNGGNSATRTAESGSSEYASYGDMMNPERRAGGNRQATATPSAPSDYVDYGDMMSPERRRDNAFQQDDEETREAYAIYASIVSERAQELTGRVGADGDRSRQDIQQPSSPDPIALPPLPPSRRGRRGHRQHLRSSSNGGLPFSEGRDSLFFSHAPPPLPPAPGTLTMSAPRRTTTRTTVSSLLATALNHPPATSSARETGDSATISFGTATRTENFVPAIRSSAPKPVLLLYCGNSEKARTGPVELPKDFYYIDSTPSTSTSQVGQSKASYASVASQSIDATALVERDGGGCGRLVCVRGGRTSIPDMYESDAPPPAEAVDWLEEMPVKLATPNGSDLSTWPDCTCVRATLGCRGCGNVVGQSTISTCKRCMRFSFNSKWLFYAHATAARRRIRHVHPPPYLTRAQASTSEGSEADGVQWRAKDNSLLIPARAKDVDDGLAGEAGWWQASVDEAFGISPVAPAAVTVAEERRASPPALRGSSLFAPPSSDGDVQQPDEVEEEWEFISQRGNEVLSGQQEERPVTATGGSRPTRTISLAYGTIETGDAVDRLLRQGQARTNPGDPASFDSLVQEAFRLESARYQTTSAFVQERSRNLTPRNVSQRSDNTSARANMIRRDIREFIAGRRWGNLSELSTTTGETRRRTMSPVRDQGSALANDRVVRRRLTIIQQEAPSLGELVGR